MQFSPFAATLRFSRLWTVKVLVPRQRPHEAAPVHVCADGAQEVLIEVPETEEISGAKLRAPEVLVQREEGVEGFAGEAEREDGGEGEMGCYLGEEFRG